MQSIGYHWRSFFKFAEQAGIIITLVLLPIDRLPYVHYTPFGLGLISLILLLLATTYRLAVLTRAGQYDRLKRYTYIGALLALPVIGYSISSFYAIDHAYALSATKTLLAVCLRAFCFFVLVSENGVLWRTIRKTIYVTTAVVVVFGFFQFFFDVFGASPKVTDLRKCCTSNSTYVFPRVYSTALEPLYLDHFLMLPIWLLTFEFFRDKKSLKDKRLLALFVGTGALFILTVARSATIALLVAGIVFLAGLKWFKTEGPFIKTMVRRWGAALAIALALVLVSGVAAIYIPKNSRYNDTGFGSLRLFGGHAVDVNDGSARTRYDLWPKSIKYIEEKPLEGVGANNSRIKLFLNDYRKGIKPSKLQPFNNDLIALVVELGLLAVVFFGPLLITILKAVISAYKSGWAVTGAPFALIVISMFIQGNFFQSLLLTRLWVVVGLLLAAVYSPMLSADMKIKRSKNAKISN